MSSPVCYAPEFERARNAELIVRLNELLEAERAGVRVTVQTLADIPAQDTATRALVESVHHDEVEWCVMLLHAIRDLDGKSSSRTGEFFQKAMAIADVRERLAFLNRGQGWVAKKLRELLPMADDPELARNLTRMLDSHVENLDRVNAWMASRA